MVVHFDTETEALNHLTSHSFKLLTSGFWMSRCGVVKASMHPVTGTEKFALAYQMV